MGASFGLIEAALIAFCYFLGTCEIIWLGAFCSHPIFLGMIFGLAYGDITQGMIIGGTLQLYYLGNVALAGTILQDQALACCIAIPLALKTGIGAEAALIVAIPFGVFGGTLDSFRRLINGRFNAMVNKAIDELNFKKITFNGFYLPIMFQFVVRWIPAFVILFFAGSGIATLLENLPAWLSNGFIVIGNMLPALGLIMCATLIGQKKLIPFFFLGFIGMTLTGMTSFTFAVIGVLIAIIYINTSNDYADIESGGNFFENVGEVRTNSLFTKKDHFVIGQRVFNMHRASNSLEFLYGSSYAVAVMPALRKIYGDDTEGLKEALHRHTLPYMTEQAWGQVITGAALAMEEEIANGNEEVTGEEVVAFKSGLMGPMASFGDTILYVTLMPIVNSLIIPFAMSGQVWTGFVPVLYFWIFIGSIYYPMQLLGYNAGRTSIITLMKSGMLKKVMAGAGVLGMIMMGAMSANYAKITTPVTWVVNAGQASETTIVLQDVLNGLMPNILTLIFVGLTYFYIMKGGKYIKVIITVCIIGMLGSILGIL